VASEVAAASYRAILAPDHRLTYAGSYKASLSTLTQAGPKPGTPEPQQDTYATLTSSGTQSVNKALRLRCLSAGNAEPDGGTFGWRYNGDTDWRGWDPPTTLSGWEAIEYSSSANRWGRAHAITLPNGKVVVASPYISGNDIRVAVRSPSTYAWTQVTVTTTGLSEYVAPTLLLLPSGRILCFYLSYNATEAWVEMSFSDDDGATWTLGQTNCLRTRIDVSGTVTVKTMRAALLNGVIMLVVGIRDTSLTCYNVIKQYASTDLGAHFDLLDTWTGSDRANMAAFPELVSTGTQIVFAYLRQTIAAATDCVPYYRRVGSAFALLSSADPTIATNSGNPMRWGVFGGGDVTDGDLSMWRDDDGTFYMVGRDVVDAGEPMSCYTQRSQDDGVTWEMIGTGGAAGYGTAWWRGDDAAAYPVNLVGTHCRGQAVVVHQFEANPGTYDDSLCVAYLGGYTTVCLPSVASYTDSAQRASFERTWLPFDLPDATGATWTAGGTATATLANSSVNIVDAALNTKTYTTAPTSTLEQGILVHAQAEVEAGTFFLDVQIGDATPASYRARVAVTPTAITVTDQNGGGTYTATTATTAGTTGVQVLVAMGQTGAPADDGRLRVWWRSTASGGETDRSWTLLGTTSTLKKAVATANEIQWGALAAASTDVKVRLVQYSYGAYTGITGTYLYGGQTNPDELLGRSFSPYPVSVDDGVRVAMTRGPAMQADVWNIDTAYDYPVSAIFPETSPSPRQTWRSTGDATQVDIVVEYDSTLDQEIPTLTPVLGLALINVNFKTFELAGYDKDTAAYVTIASGDTSFGQAGMLFVRQGDTVLPYLGVSSTTSYYYTANILEDSHVKLSTSGQDAVTLVRRIRTNDSGAWNNSTTKRTRIVCEDVVSTDPSGGLGQTCDILSRDVVVIIPGADKYTRFRLRIPVQPTAEDYFEIGSMVLGPVFRLGHQYSRGRVMGYEHDVSLNESKAGVRRPRRNQPQRRTKEFSWVEGVDVSAATGITPTPNYTLPYTGATVPDSAPADTPYTVAGAVEYLRGSLTPMVFLDSVAKGSNSDALVLVNRNVFLYGRWLTNPRLENVLGDEWTNPGEVLTAAVSTISEET